MIPAWLPDTVTTMPAEMTDSALLWGLEAIEVRMVGNDRVPEINERPLRARLAQAKLSVASIDPGLFQGPIASRADWLGDGALLEDAIGCARRLGAGCVVVSSFENRDDQAVAALRFAGDRAAKAGLLIAVLHEPEMGCASMESLDALLARVDHPHVGAVWQPALVPGEAIPADFPARTILVRCEDRSADGLPTLPGQGGVPWVDVLARLRAVSFAGAVSLVLPPDAGPTEGLRHASAMITLIRQASR